MINKQKPEDKEPRDIEDIINIKEPSESKGGLFLRFIGGVSKKYHEQYKINVVQTAKEIKKKVNSLKTDFDIKKDEAEQDSLREIAKQKEEHNILLDTQKSVLIKEKNALETNYRQLIIKHCKSYNINSPFDKPGNNASIVQKKFLKFSDLKKTLFLDKLKKIKITPNDEQKAMLFSENPATCIQAGAGSGKSTILATRVALLYLVQGIPLEKITVTTFTRESRKEFIEKVIKNINELSNHTTVINEKIGRSIVRTFHSLAYKVHKEFGDNRRIIFGDWTPIFESEDGEEVDIEDLNHLTKEERQQKYTRDKSIPLMSDLMNRTYQELYTGSEDFRNIINKLFKDSIKQMCFNQKSHQGTVYYSLSEKNELALSSQLFKDWLADNEENYNDILKQYPPIDEYRAGYGSNTKKLNYHLYLPKQNARVFLSLNSSHYDGRIEFSNFKNTGKNLSSWILFRKRFSYFVASSSYIWVDSERALKTLLDREEKLQETLSPPFFAYYCVGELNKKENDKNFAPIYAQLSSFSEFIYSLGKSICEIDTHDYNNSFNNVPKADDGFFKAALLYNQALEQTLNNENVITFEQIFHEFKSREHPALNNSQTSQLAWCENLMIDEFQDISANIIQFLNNIKQIYIQKTQLGSIMFVGDGNQSIYSWRGSSYLYLKYPDIFFPTHSKFAILPLVNNYRSTKRILDFSKLALDKMGVSQTLIAANKNKQKMESEILIKRPLKSENVNVLDYDNLATKLLAEVNRIKATKENPVYLIYRGHSLAKDTKHKEWNSVFNRLTEEGVVKGLTIHTSKGLEAYSIFVLGDIAPGTWNPLKEAIYSWCEVGISYSEAQQHEAYCLCYVAITRAENNVYWYLNNPQERGIANHYLSQWSDVVS